MDVNNVRGYVEQYGTGPEGVARLIERSEPPTREEAEWMVDDTVSRYPMLEAWRASLAEFDSE